MENAIKTIYSSKAPRKLAPEASSIIKLRMNGKGSEPVATKKIDSETKTAITKIPILESRTLRFSLDKIRVIIMTTTSVGNAINAPS
jgi:hypothetical protein